MGTVWMQRWLAPRGARVPLALGALPGATATALARRRWRMPAYVDRRVRGLAALVRGGIPGSVADAIEPG
jgi:hypothetical protein